jgi:predicted transcriptional regulator
MDFNKRIKEKGLKKSWIAEQIGISRTRLSFYLNETRPMPEDVRKDLIKVLS